MRTMKKIEIDHHLVNSYYNFYDHTPSDESVCESESTQYRVSEEYFSKLLGAYVARVEFNFVWLDTPHNTGLPCDKCAYNRLCQKFDNDTLYQLEGLDSCIDFTHSYIIIESVYPVKDLHETLFKINNSCIIRSEKLELMNSLIDLEYLEYLINNNMIDGTRGI